MTTIWSATVSRIGGDAADMIEEGVIILFGEPVPPALLDVSVVHEGGASPSREIAAGDAVTFGEQTFEVTAVGDKANANLSELGHVVLYVNQPDQELLPGAVLATGPDVIVPALGAALAVTGA
ncbi:PTS glucitol/sorbitol transporter subunit IIA [Brachybacterium sp. FME24]|uniref:PTS glucitol/sorbitol transporter subunit IIA n=1 Tax=Brachybacterium sp. FME24 TaxID=2742605 RepID=UPI001867B60E|nr:PTS glucitol/sorbitol transporter subunit IIA [Brachybacterium sp. FME24]